MGRLIDADKFKTALEKAISKNEDMDCLDFLRISSVIDAQPTAYDVDKVVEQLEELEGRYNSVDFGIKGIICKAIEIVKSGGINHE